MSGRVRTLRAWPGRTTSEWYLYDPRYQGVIVLPDEAAVRRYAAVTPGVRLVWAAR